MPVEPIHHGILAADIEGFGRLERSNPVRFRLRAALHRLLDQSLRQSGIEPWRCQRSDHGDCVLILLEPQVSTARLLDPFLPRLTAALARHNRAVPAAERLRLRVVVHAGEILRDAHGHSGEDLNTAFRLLDSEALHACLAGAPADTAVIVSDAVYRSIVKHGYGRIDPAGYRPVTVVAKETRATAWVHAPTVPSRARRSRDGRAIPPPAAVAERAGFVPAQLPPDVAAFTGRRRELRRLRGLLTAADRRPRAPAAALSGIGGVGKSALAIHAAHGLAARFPDGQIHVDLRGSSHGLSPMAPIEALGCLLRALGVRGEDVPVGLEDAAARFRSLLAGRRVLVVLDNASSDLQVRPLLPVVSGSAALVTSRQPLVSLEGAVHLRLEVLSSSESVTLLRRLAGAERVAAEPTAARTIALRCGHLPLALRIAGARLAARPSWPLHALAEQLADERHRLDRLRLGDLAVRASFQLSYQALLDSGDGPLAARAFRLLGLLDGPDVSTATVAALVDRPPQVAEALLERLVDAQVLETPVPGRFRMHDLLRLFARERADQRERATTRRAALRRALRHYLVTAERASRLVQPADLRRGAEGRQSEATRSGRSGRGVQLRDRRDALAWLEAERENLIAAAHQAATGPPPVARVAVELASTLFWFLQARGHWRDWEALNLLAVQVTRRLGDARGESHALSDLAGACHRLGRLDEAVAFLEEGLRIHRDLGDRAGEQAVLSNLGIVYRDAGRLDDAIASAERSLDISRESRDRYGEAIVLNTLGKTFREQGRFDAAIATCGNSLRIFEELGDAYGQGNVLANIGEACAAAGRAEEAVEFCQRSLALFREVGDRSDEAEALWRLGTALHALGWSDQARSRWADALAIFRSIGSPKAAELENLLRDDSSGS